MKVVLFLTFMFSLILIEGRNFHGGQDIADTRKGCPLGYMPEEGTVTEKGLVGEYVATLNKCAEDCKLRGNCYAFTHSSKKQTCVLLENDEPTMGNWKDEQFCKKIKGGDPKYIVTEIGGKCEKDYVSIKDQAECNFVSAEIASNNAAFEGWSTNSISEFKSNNEFTSGCYWNFGGKNLFFNPFGVDGRCVGPPDCRTICKKKVSGCPSLFPVLDNDYEGDMNHGDMCRIIDRENWNRFGIGWVCPHKCEPTEDRGPPFCRISGTEKFPCRLFPEPKCPTEFPYFDNNHNGNQDHGDLCRIVHGIELDTFNIGWVCPIECEATKDRDHPFCKVSNTNNFPCRSKQVVDIENEIDILGKEITSLTVADRNAQKAEEVYKIQLSIISEKLNSTEVRAQYGDEKIQHLQGRINNILKELASSKIQ